MYDSSALNKVPSGWISKSELVTQNPHYNLWIQRNAFKRKLIQIYDKQYKMG